MSEIIYKRRYPHRTAEEEMEETLKWEKEHPEEAPEGTPPTYSEFCQRMLSQWSLVALEERKPLAEQFVKAAIKAGEMYELDTEITRRDSHIQVTYYFDCRGDMDYLMPVLRQADTVSFLTGIQGFDIALALAYYTHAVYHSGRLIHPLP